MRDLNLPRKYFFVVFITICLFISCKPTVNNLISIQGKNFEITNENKQVAEIDSFILPYRKHVQQEMASVLAYNPIDLVKQTDAMNAPIGNFIAEATFEIANPIFFKKTGENIDFVLLNWGGIRSDLPKGDVTMGSVYSLMPFENKLVIVKIKGEKINEMAEYLIKAKKPHPLSKQVQLHITPTSKVKYFTINGKLINSNRTYWVATSDYLMNGGDGMMFFQNPIDSFEMDYLLRNILIDYFKKIGTVQAEKDNRFILVED
ncbi:MAG: 5'-nucleotidase [Capnocytophaga sp.]|nr:5'-nucleotidase [Capnocytophaga sp.]